MRFEIDMLLLKEQGFAEIHRINMTDLLELEGMKEKLQKIAKKIMERVRKELGDRDFLKEYESEDFLFFDMDFLKQHLLENPSFLDIKELNGLNGAELLNLVISKESHMIVICGKILEYKTNQEFRSFKTGLINYNPKVVFIYGATDSVTSPV